MNLTVHPMENQLNETHDASVNSGNSRDFHVCGMFFEQFTILLFALVEHPQRDAAARELGIQKRSLTRGDCCKVILLYGLNHDLLLRRTLGHRKRTDRQ